MNQKLTHSELLQAVKTLALLVRRRFPLDDAIRAVGEDSPVWIEIGDHVSRGDSVGEALGRYPNIFSSPFRHLLQAAAKSETPETILDALACSLEIGEQVRGEIRSLLRYPILLLSFLTLECGVLLLYGLPKVVLPMWAAVHNAVVPGWLETFLGLLGTLCMVLALVAAVASKKVELVLPLASRFPAFQQTVNKSDLALWARSVAAFLQAGHPLPEALACSARGAWNKSLETELLNLEGRLHQGDTLSQALADCDQIDPQVRWAVTAGENKEDLSATLLYAAERLEWGLAQRCQAFFALLQPSAVLVVAALTTLVLAPFWWSMYQTGQSLAL